MSSYSDIFSIRPEDKVPGRGKVLISEPFLSDRFFNRTIVFLTEHGPEGSVGFILNRVLELRVNTAVEELECWEENLSIGGPVSSDTLHYLHSLGEKIPGSRLVVPGIWWGGDLDVIRSLINSGHVNRDQLRFFLGYAGWSKGQLQKELKDNSWVIANVPNDVVMKSRGDVWKDVLRSLDNKYKIWAEFPESPEMN
jgi:putative transcriptional regulator